MTRVQLFPQPGFIAPFDRPDGLGGLRIGLTGARGVLGGVLARRLAHLDPQAYAGDITDDAALEAFFAHRHLDLFFHFAAIVPVTAVAADRARAFAVNAAGAEAVARRFHAANPRGWFFLASSSHVYAAAPVSAPLPRRVDSDEGPSGDYGRSKLEGETRCRAALEGAGAGDRLCIARIFSFSHATQREPFLVPTLARAIREMPVGASLPVVNAPSIRDICDAETVIDAVLHLARRRHAGTLNVGTGIGMSVGDIARHLAHAAGREVRIAPVGRGEPDALVADVAPLRTVLERAA